MGNLGFMMCRFRATLEGSCGLGVLGFRFRAFKGLGSLGFFWFQVYFHVPSVECMISLRGRLSGHQCSDCFQIYGSRFSPLRVQSVFDVFHVFSARFFAF